MSMRMPSLFSREPSATAQVKLPLTSKLREALARVSKSSKKSEAPAADAFASPSEARPASMGSRLNLEPLRVLLSNASSGASIQQRKVEMLPSNRASRSLQHDTAINLLSALGGHLDMEGVLRKPGKEALVKGGMSTLRSGGKANLEGFDHNALSTMLKRMCLQGYVLIPHSHYTQGAEVKDPKAQAAAKKAIDLLLDVEEHSDKNLMTLENVAAAAKVFFEAKPASRTPWGKRREEAKANAAMWETSKKQEEQDRAAVGRGDRTAALSAEKADPQILAFLQAAKDQRSAQRAHWAQSAPKIGDIAQGFGENISTEDFFKT